MSSFGTNAWNAFGIGWNDWCFVSLVLPNRCGGADGEDVADDGLWLPWLGIIGGDSERFDIDGTRAGRFASNGDAGNDGGLSAPCPATLDIFALTRTLTLGEIGVFSSGFVRAERAGEDAALSVCDGVESTLEDALPRRCRGNDGAGGVPAVSARCRDSGSGEVELLPLVRAVSLAFTAEPVVGDALATRDCGGLKGDGARLGAVVDRVECVINGGTPGLRVWIVALLLTLALALMSGGDRDVAGCLKGDAGRARS